MFETIKSWFTKKDVTKVSLSDTVKAVDLQERVVDNAALIMPPKPQDPSILDITDPPRKVWFPRVFAVYVTKFDPADKSVFDEFENPQYGDMVVVGYNPETIMAMYMYKKHGWEEI